MNAKTIEEYYAMDPDKPFDAQAWASDRKNYATVNSCDLQNRFMPTAPPQTAPPQTTTQAQTQAEAEAFVKTHIEMNKLLERKNTLSTVNLRESSEYNESFEDAHEITQLAYDNITTNWYLGTEPISYTGGRPQQIIRK